MKLKWYLFEALGKLFPAVDSLRYRNNSFSQEGEDLIVMEVLDHKKNGFFIDVGAHHPYRFSNTFLLKKHGWRGINIEPNPILYKHFQELRKDDINLNCGISGTTEQFLTYYEFNEPALNTFSPETYNQRLLDGYTLIRKRLVEVTTLQNICRTHAANKNVDLLSVDVEGLDFEVLNTLDWKQNSPKCILIEDHEYNFQKPSKIDDLLTGLGYKLKARTLRNSIYLNKDI